jgi:hypothetical protein
MSNVNKWNRNCPECHKELYYSRKDNFMTAEKENRLCKHCVRIGNKNHMFGLHPKPTYGMLGKKHKLESNEKRSKSLKGRIFSNEDRQKIRSGILKRFEKLGIPNSTDKGADEFFKERNKEGFNLKPKRFIEIGYDADGYDAEKHIWWEYDTPYHLLPYQKKRDLVRQNNIIEHFKKLGNPLKNFIRTQVDKDGKVIWNQYIYK